VKLTVSVKGEVKDALANRHTSPAFFLAERGADSAAFQVGGTKTNYEVFKYGGSTAPVKVGTPSVHKATFTFDPEAVGLPSKYEWLVVMNICHYLDQAPNKGFASGSAKRC
jgi:hypothetical protein